MTVSKPWNSASWVVRKNYWFLRDPLLDQAMCFHTSARGKKTIQTCCREGQKISSVTTSPCIIPILDLVYCTYTFVTSTIYCLIKHHKLMDWWHSPVKNKMHNMKPEYSHWHTHLQISSPHSVNLEMSEHLTWIQLDLTTQCDSVWRHVFIW